MQPVRVAHRPTAGRAYAECMASTPLTLAALATSAVPGLEVVAYREHSTGGADDFSAAVIQTADQELIVRVPRNASAEVRQSAEMLGVSALSEGARAELPFRVPETLGITRAGETRAVVSTFLPGAHIEAHDLASDALLLQPLADALAAIHRLPLSTVHQAGLPSRSAEEARASAARLVERAADTRLLPDLVRTRWHEALDSTRLWDFAPTVIHGSFDADQLLVADDAVVGVLGWDQLSVGDPAADMAWLLGIGPEVFDAVLARYLAAGGPAGSTELRARAKLNHEFEVARWLLHGVETHDEAVVDDAVAMLDRLVDRVARLGNPVSRSRPATTPEEVERLLDEIPEVTDDPRSETAEYEALDEDRVFTADGDFADDEDPADDASPARARGAGISGTNISESTHDDASPAAALDGEDSRASADQGSAPGAPEPEP